MGRLGEQHSIRNLLDLEYYGVLLPPGSRELYPSLAPVQWAIETAAGSGIGPGDRVQLE